MAELAPTLAARPARLTFRAMNTDVTLRLAGELRAPAAETLARAREVFTRVEAACTRFVDDSPLMRANAAGTSWCRVPAVCHDALVEAHLAYRETGGLFDPRVLRVLVSLGYDRTLPFDDGPVRLPRTGPGGGPVVESAPWEPAFDPSRVAVRVGPVPVDLGGIGKGLAVRWAAEVLATGSDVYLVEAGGDCALGEAGPDGDGWRVGVEDPTFAGSRATGEDPVAVLRLTDTGCATSSLRKRSWAVAGEQVHHVIDPRTGRSAAGGLRSVTVVDPDPARAEVWSKSLLVAGADRVAALAAERDVAALWVADDGTLTTSAAIGPRVMWRADER